MVEKKVISPPQTKLENLLKLFQEQKFDDAEKLALSISQAFPDHPYSWQILIEVYKSDRKSLKLLDAIEKLIKITPENPQLHNNYGLVMQGFDRFKDAEESFKKSIELKPNFDLPYNNLAILMKNKGRLNEAEINLRKAIKINPEFIDAYNNLGLVMSEFHKPKEAELSFKNAISLNPQIARFHCNLGKTLNDLGRSKEAEISFKKALELEPNRSETYCMFGITLMSLNRNHEAESNLRKAIALKPDFDQALYNLGMILFLKKDFKNSYDLFKLDKTNASKRWLLRCSFILGKKSEFFEYLDFFKGNAGISPLIGSLINRAEIRYGIDLPNPFCKNPLNYVQNINLNEKYNFDKIFVKTIKNILENSKTSYRKQKLLKNGQQTTGDIFIKEEKATIEIKNIITSEIERYIILHNKSEEGFLRNWPTNFSINAWIISMKSGGKLSAHMHDNGWVSGSVYINVPPKLKKDSGNLVVTKDFDKENQDPDYIKFNNKPLSFLSKLFQSKKKKNEKKIINVVTGNLCLFPSSLHHYTIPFEEDK